MDAFLLAQVNIHTLSGDAFNIGGGLGNTISLVELLDLVERFHGPNPRFIGIWRPGDERYYVSDTRKFKVATGWAPKVTARAGISACSNGWRNWLVSAGPARTGFPPEVSCDVLLINPPWSFGGEHLFRLPRAAPAAGIRLLESIARSGGA